MGVVEFGRNENQRFHTFRHVVRAGLGRKAVEEAIRQQLTFLAAELPPGFSQGLVVVEGRELRYTAYRLPDGGVHVGRITVE